MSISADRLTQIRRGALIATAGATALIATEVLPISQAPTANASVNEKSTSFDPARSLGKLGERISSKVLECITRIRVDAFRAPDQDQDITGRKIVVFNLSNPDGAVTLEVGSDQQYRGTERGNDTYDLNTYNPLTGEKFALLRGAALDDLCGPVDPDCKKTKIGGYEEAPDGQRRQLPPLTVDCPSNEICDAWGNVPVTLRVSPPTPTPAPTSVPTPTPLPVPPAQLPRTGN